MTDPAHKDDVQIDETTPDVPDVSLEDEETATSAKLKQLRDKLTQCQQEKKQAEEDLQRTTADFLNSKRRLAEASQAEVSRATDTMLGELFPVIDSFDMAMSDTAAWEAIDENWRNGMTGVYQQLQSILKRYSVTAFAAPGDVFDPNRHEALSTVDEAGPAEEIVQVIQTGYERAGTVIRPAKVIIRK